MFLLNTSICLQDHTALKPRHMQNYSSRNISIQKRNMDSDKERTKSDTVIPDISYMYGELLSLIRKEVNNWRFIT
jgi:hypothetical protein